MSELRPILAAVELASVEPAAVELASSEPAAARAEPDVESSVAVRLRVLEGLPVSEHVPVYEDVHRLLVEALSALDEG